MGLNDDVENELGKLDDHIEGLDNEEGKGPVTNGQPVQPAATEPKKELKEQDVVKAQILIKYASLESIVNNLKTLKSSLKRLTNQKTISIHDVNDIKNSHTRLNSVFPSNESYTARQTKVGYDAAVRSLKSEISKEEYEFSIELDKYVAGPVDNLRNILTFLYDDYIEKILDVLYYNKTKFVGMSDFFKSSKNLVFNIDEDYKNISLITIQNLDFKKINVDSINWNPYKNSIEIVNELLKSNRVRIYIKSSLENEPLEVFLDKICKDDKQDIDLNVCDLVHFFETATSFSKVDTLRNTVKNLIDEINNNIKTFSNNELSDEVLEHITEKQLELIKIYKRAHALIELLYVIKPLNVAVLTLSGLFNKLA